MASSDFILLAVAAVGLAVLTKLFLWFIDKQMGGMKNAPVMDNSGVDAADDEIRKIMEQNEGNLNNKDVKKAMAKAVKKKEKAEKKAQEDYQREVRKAREEQRLEEQRKKDEERALKLREEEERQRQEEEERLRQEEEEYKKWEQYIVLEGEGTDAKEDFFADEERVSKFITYLTTSKVCVLDEVAAEFGMKGDEVLTIIERLEKEGRMTVLVDDRGKLIVVTAEELAAVAEVIKKEGRVALSHLTKLCGGLVRLNLHVCSTNKFHGQ